MIQNKAQAEIIAIILIILLSLGSFIVLWNIVNLVITDSSDEVGIESFTTKFEIQDVKIYNAGLAEVKVYRGTGKGELTSIDFLFLDETGNINKITKTNVVLEELETKKFIFKESEIFGVNSVKKIKEVSIIPYINNKPGFEIKESSSNIKKDSNGERIYDSVDGLISWWKFDGDGKDSVGNNDGTLENGAQIVNDELDVNINDGYFLVPHSDDFSFSNKKLSVSMWVKLEEVPDSLDVFFTKALHVGGGVFDGFYLNTREDGKIRQVTGSVYTLSNNGLSLGEWTHVILISDDVNTKIYLNGVLDNSFPTPVSNIATSTNIFIGDYYNTFSSYSFDGLIDNVMIFDKVLSEEEVGLIYEIQDKNQ